MFVLKDKLVNLNLNTQSLNTILSGKRLSPDIGLSRHQLAEALGIRTDTVGPHLQNLKNEGLVRKITVKIYQNGKQYREFRYFLTEKGWEMANNLFSD